MPEFDPTAAARDHIRSGATGSAPNRCGQHWMPAAPCRAQDPILPIPFGVTRSKPVRVVDHRRSPAL